MMTLFGILALLGRIMIAAMFLLTTVIGDIPHFSDTAAAMGAAGVPLPTVMLIGAIVFKLAGGLSVAVGYRARIGATLLLVFLLLATYFFHDFWTLEDPQARQMQMLQLMKNASMMGAMLLIIAHGPGLMSLDGRLVARRPAVPSL